MSSSFDHYHKWLAIPPESQPPNLYQLLALPLFESDHDVIEAAADQRMAHIRSYQSGKHRELSQRLLNELSAARLTLLDDAKRLEYDSGLKQSAAIEPSQSSDVAPIVAPLITPTPDFDLTLPAPDPFGESEFGSTSRRLDSSRRKAVVSPLMIAIAIAAVLLGMTCVIVILTWPDGSTRLSTDNERSPDSPFPSDPTLDQLRKEYAMHNALQTLSRDPDDPDANLIAGKHFCFERAEWERGLNMLAKGSDAALRRLATADISGDHDGSAMAALWREAAAQQPESVSTAMLDRSAFWDVESMPQLASAKQLAAFGRVIRVAEQNSDAPLGESIDLLTLVDVDRHAERGEWIRNVSDVSCAKGGAPLLMVPVRIRGSYRLELTITQLGNDTIHFVLPAGLSQFNVHLHGYHGDLSEVVVDGKPIVRERPGRLKLNERSNVSIDVTLDEAEAALRVLLNGKPHLACTTSITTPDSSIRHANALKIGGSGKSQFAVHDARLTLRSGGIRYMDDPESIE